MLENQDDGHIVREYQLITAHYVIVSNITSDVVMTTECIVSFM